MLARMEKEDGGGEQGKENSLAAQIISILSTQCHLHTQIAYA